MDNYRNTIAITIAITSSFPVDASAIGAKPWKPRAAPLSQQSLVVLVQGVEYDLLVPSATKASWHPSVFLDEKIVKKHRFLVGQSSINGKTQHFLRLNQLKHL